MAKQATIKQIAELSGVSPGTVDRVLHNRGKVSAANLAKINEVLQRVGYRSNIHSSALALKRTFSIVVNIPDIGSGSYWEGLAKGIESCLHEYSDIDITYKLLTYDQYDSRSFTDSARKVLASKPDGVIIGPTFNSETQALCRELDAKNIPYSFVDTIIPNTNAVSSFSANQELCGRVLGNMFELLMPAGSELAIFSSKRRGSESYNSTLRKEALYSYIRRINPSREVQFVEFKSIGDGLEDEMIAYLAKHPRIGAVAVLNSRGYMVAEVLKQQNIKGIHIGCFDLTGANKACLLDGSISFVIYQKPETQGFEALKSLISYLIFKKKDTVSEHCVGIEVILKESIA